MTRSNLLARVVALLGLLVVAGNSSAFAQEGGAPLPLERILDSVGAIVVPEGTSGSFDPSGWVMTTDSTGAPRFLRKESPALHAVPEDRHWDDRFGPPGIGGVVNAIAVIGNEVFIAGRFRVAGTTIANNVVSFNVATGAWQALGDDEVNGVGGPVYALAAYRNLLYVGGTFESAGGVRASGVARWDVGRRRWSSLGGGVANVENTAIYPGHVYAMVADSQSVFVGGLFLMADADTVGNLARWDITSQSWSAACKSDVNRTNGVIRSLALHGGSLYVGGEYTLVADIAANRIARWDLADNTWHRMGEGVDGAVLAVAAHAGRVVIGGAFDSSGSRPTRAIAEWDGSAWRQLGAGLAAPVHALHSDGTSLYIGGAFSSTASGAHGFNAVAQWSGGGFNQIGLGVAGDSAPVVRALATAGGRLFAGGAFTAAGLSAAYSVAQWDTAWSALGRRPRAVLHGTDAPVHAVAIDRDDVYVGGDFSTAGGVRANRVARWNRSTGLWSDLGGGIDGAGALVRALELDTNGNLYVGGIFEGAGGVASRGIVRWDGARWQSMAGGVNGDAPFVFALLRAGAAGESIYVGGAFDGADTVRSPRVIEWSTVDNRWIAIGGGPNGPPGVQGDSTYTYVAAMALYAPNILIGGEFTRVGTRRADRLAWIMQSPRRVDPVGPVTDPGVNGPVSAIHFHGGTAYVGGSFTRAGGLPARNLARFNGGQFWHVDSLFPDGPVHTIAVVNDDVIIGGEFRSVGTVAAAGVARFHVPTRTWSPLESGTNGPVYAVAAIDDEIYAGGSFSSAGAARVANVGQWKRTAWSSMGSDPSIGINDTVFALAIRDRNVYVGGRFRTSGGIRTNGIAVWNGERWLPVGGGVSGAAATVRALAFDSSGALYAGGSFLAAGGDSAAHVARWDGSRWSSLGSGIAGPPQRSTTVNAIAIDDDGVHVGGVFSTAGGVPAANVARWNPATSQWSALGAGVRGGSPYATVNALAIHEGRLVAAGRFDSADAVGATSVAAWDGSAWQAMGAVTLEGRALATRGADLVLATGGLERITIPPASSFLRSSHYLYRWNGSAWTTLDSGGGVIYSLAFDRNGDIFAGGWFSALGTVESNGIAHFVGGRWQPLGSGLIGVDHMNEFTIGSAFAIGATGDDLYVGGNFIIAGRKPSYYFAHWNRAISAAPETSTLPLHDFDVRMHVMPNPVDRGATLRIDAASGVATVRLFDMLGRERMRVAGDGGSRVVEIVLDDPIDAGAYIVRVETEEGVGTGRIVVR